MRQACIHCGAEVHDSQVSRHRCAAAERAAMLDLATALERETERRKSAERCAALFYEVAGSGYLDLWEAHCARWPDARKKGE